MVNKTELALEKLKEVRLGLFRSAANLDTVISNIENSLDNGNREYLRLLIGCERLQRADYRRVTEYYDLNTKEAEAWEQLINSVK